MGYRQPSSGLPFKEMGSSPAKSKGDNLHRISQENKALRKARGTFYAPGAAPQPKTPNVPGFNIEGSKFSKANTPGFETTKIGKDLAAKKKFNLRQSSKQKAKDWVKRILKKGSTKAFGVLGLMGGDPLSATASDVRTKTEGEQIKDLLTKHKLRGGN